MARGMLRIYLGAAPGVGKTYAMLNEGRRRKGRGTDVAVGYVEPHGRPNTSAQIGDLEVVPRAKIQYKGQSFEEMDVDAVLARKPKVALVDELAHTNIPGSRNAKRWEDIEELLAQGIDVISTVNIQHLESLNDVVQSITGIAQRETVPDSWVRAADQIELVDMTPEALRRRMAHGNIYPADLVDTALGNYFRPGNLAALRELALLWVADRVEEGLKDYRERHGIVSPWETRERVVVGLTGAPSGEILIRRAARIAQRAKAELMGVYVRTDDSVRRPSREVLERNKALLAELGGVFLEVVGYDVARSLVEVAKAENATQVVLGATRRSRWTEFLHGSVINTLIRESGRSLDVHVISTSPEETPQPAPRVRRFRWVQLPRQRVIQGFVLGAIGLPLLTVVMAPARQSLSFSSNVLYLLLIAAVAVVGGAIPALLSAVAGFMLLDYYFTPPIHHLRIADARDLSELITFIVIAAVVSILVDQSTRRFTEVRRAQLETEAVASMSSSILTEGDPVPKLVENLRSAFSLEAVSVLRHQNGSWSTEFSQGPTPPKSPEEASFTVPLTSNLSLAVRSSGMAAADQRSLTVCAAQLAIAYEGRRLRSEAAAAAQAVKANELRLDVLASVSHDLYAPLASIRTAAERLLATTTESTTESRRLLETIDSESTRLDSLVANLLDISRLQAGAYQVMIEEVPLTDVLAAAVKGVDPTGHSLTIDLPEDLPMVLADAAFLERAVANMVDNALRFSPPGETVKVEAGHVGGRVVLRVIDRGRGISLADRERVFKPFQQVADVGDGKGVGLGLPIASGFIVAMGAELEIEDTPGGGTTMLVSIPVAGPR